MDKRLRMENFVLWGMEIPDSWLPTSQDSDYVRSMPEQRPTVEWIWSEMDRVWDSFGLDNRQPLTKQPIGEFYSHPVWLVNGVFTATDPESSGHRSSIAKYLASKNEINNVADYGGGFGALALAVAEASSNTQVSVIDPYPPKAGLECTKAWPNVEYVEAPQPDTHDAIVAEDVLEHVEDPVGLAFELSSAVRGGGLLVFANCFQPVIKCHLPATFHLRRTFPWVMRRMGLDFVGRIPGAEHALVFRKQGTLDEHRARRAEAMSRRIGPAINIAAPVAGRIKRSFR